METFFKIKHSLEDLISTHQLSSSAVGLILHLGFRLVKDSTIAITTFKNASEKLNIKSHKTFLKLCLELSKIVKFVQKGKEYIFDFASLVMNGMEEKIARVDINVVDTSEYQKRAKITIKKDSKLVKNTKFVEVKNTSFSHEHVKKNLNNKKTTTCINKNVVVSYSNQDQLKPLPVGAETLIQKYVEFKFKRGQIQLPEAYQYRVTQRVRENEKCLESINRYLMAYDKTLRPAKPKYKEISFVDFTYDKEKRIRQIFDTEVELSVKEKYAKKASKIIEIQCGSAPDSFKKAMIDDKTFVIFQEENKDIVKKWDEIADKELRSSYQTP